MSENLISIFPKARLDALLAHARGENPGVRLDGIEPELLSCFLSSGPANERFHRDAAESIYVARQLEHIRAGVIEMVFPAMKSSLLVPFDTTPDPGAEQYTSTYASQAGEVRVSKDMTGIIPNVDVSTSQSTIQIYSLLQAYNYSLQEARASMREHKPLAADKAMRCREQLHRRLDSIALLGDTATGMKGLFTLASTATYTTPAGAGGSKLWSAKTPTEILTDWNGSVSQVVVDTKGSEIPNTTALPTACFELVTTLRVGDGTSDTVATYFKRNNPHIKQVEWSQYLDSHATAWTGKRMVNYDKNPTKVACIVPVPFEALPPDVTSTNTSTICHIRTAGVVAHAPKSVIFSDEI